MKSGRHVRRRSGVIVLKRDLLESPAFRGLSGTAVIVLLDFLGKRRMEKRGSRKNGKWAVTNDGQLTYTYREAQGRGISRTAFQGAIDRLIERGLIDVAATGAGVFKTARAKARVVGCLVRTPKEVDQP